MSSSAVSAETRRSSAHVRVLDALGVYVASAHGRSDPSAVLARLR